MIRPLNIIIVITLICSVAFVVFWLQKSPEDQKSRAKLNTNTSSVEEILHLYWDASLRGNSDALMQLTILPSKDFLQDCTKSKKVSEENEPSLKPLITPGDNNDAPIERDDGITVKNPFTSGEVPGPVNNFSEFIYMRRIAFDRTKIVERKIYQQEAILEVHVSDSSGNFSDSFKYLFFFKKDDDGWRIISAGNKDVLLSISKQINFATPRPSCEEK